MLRVLRRQKIHPPAKRKETHGGLGKGKRAEHGGVKFVKQSFNHHTHQTTIRWASHGTFHVYVFDSSVADGMSPISPASLTAAARSGRRVRGVARDGTCAVRESLAVAAPGAEPADVRRRYGLFRCDAAERWRQTERFSGALPPSHSAFHWFDPAFAPRWACGAELAARTAAPKTGPMTGRQAAALQVLRRFDPIAGLAGCVPHEVSDLLFCPASGLPDAKLSEYWDARKALTAKLASMAFAAAASMWRAREAAARVADAFARSSRRGG